MGHSRRGSIGGAAVAAGVVAGVALAVAAVAPLVAHWLTNPPDQRLVDLDVYRSGGQAVLRRAPIYDFLTQPPQLLPFTYPPFAALLAVPLALMSWPAAQWLWVVLVYGALAVTVGFAFREPLARIGGRAAPLVPVAAGALIAAMAYLMPVRDQIRFGQVDVFLVALCVADCATRSPRWPRGLLVGLATAIKLVPGVFIVYLWLSGRRRAAVTATATAATATLATFAVLPRDSADYWFGALLDSDRVGANNGTANQAIRAVFLRMYLPGPVTTVLWLACVAVVAYAGFRWARRAGLLGVGAAGPTAGPGAAPVADGGRAAPAGSTAYGAELTGVAITGLLAVALSPVAWIHHLAWLVVVVGALVGDGRDPRRLLVAAGIWVAYVVPLPWWGTRLIGPEHDAVSRFIGRIVQSSYGLGAVALIVALGAWLAGRLEISSAHDQGEEGHPRPRVGTLDP